MFRGHGILVLPFALLGLFVGSLVFGIIFLFVQVKVNWISIIMGLWCAAAAVWLYAVTFGRSRQEQVYNPATRAYESRLSRHAFLFMPPKTWALIFAGVALVGSVLGAAQAYDAEHDSDLVRTVQTWLERERQTAPTAAALHIHPNTLAYRLRRFEDVSGRNLRSTADIAELWLALRAFGHLDVTLSEG